MRRPSAFDALRRPHLMGFLLAAAVIAAPSANALNRLDFEAPGASKDLLAQLKAASLLVQAQADKKTEAQDLFSSARADYGRLVGALYSAGYYAPVIHILVDGKEAAGIAPLDAPTKIGTIRVLVQPGPLFHFSTALITPLAPKTTLPEGFHAGSPALSGVIQDAANAGISGWRDASHAKATVADKKILANIPAAAIDARITIAPGPPVTFGKMILKATSRVRPDRIRAIAGFPEGQPFDPKKEQKSADRLRKAGAFASVTLTEADTLNPDGSMDVTATVVDQKPRRLGFGAEISSSEGANLSAYWMHRNLFGGAEQFRVDAEVDGLGAQNGGIGFKLGVRLDRPATFDSRTALYVLGVIQRENLDDYNANNLSLGIGVTRELTDTMKARAGVGFDTSHVTDSTGSTNYSDFTLPLGITLDTRDKELDAHKGYYLDAGLMPFLGLGETGSGAKLTLDARAYRAIGSRVVLAGRFQLGQILGPSVAATPRDYLFYSGGGGTVRGQPYQSLGVYAISPTLRTGGKSFVGFSGEVRAQVHGPFGVVGFYDAGFISANSGFGGGQWQSGAGVGMRYDTGIGPIRLDVGLPVSGSTGKGLQLYIGIGQAF